MLFKSFQQLKPRPSKKTGGLREGSAHNLAVVVVVVIFFIQYFFIIHYWLRPLWFYLSQIVYHKTKKNVFFKIIFKMFVFFLLQMIRGPSQSKWFIGGKNHKSDFPQTTNRAQCKCLTLVSCVSEFFLHRSLCQRYQRETKSTLTWVTLRLRKILEMSVNFFIFSRLKIGKKITNIYFITIQIYMR